MAATRKLIITNLAELRTGTNSRGKPWTLYKVEATDPDGNAIVEVLTTFAKLPTDGLIDVEVERREDPQHGVSFTLRLPRAGGGLHGRVEDLERRMAALEGRP